MYEQVSGGLIVSCQPRKSGPMDDPQIVASMARSAIDGGAVGVRIEGVDNVHAVRALVDKPIIGLVKEDLPDTPVRITPHAKHVTELIEAGADIVAMDFTSRKHPDLLSTKVEIAKSAGIPVMADCSCFDDGKQAVSMGVAILGTTLSGYVGNHVPTEPDLMLVTKLADLGCFVIAEGRYNTPHKARAALAAGAKAVVVGTAITRVDILSELYALALAETANEQ